MWGFVHLMCISNYFVELVHICCAIPPWFQGDVWVTLITNITLAVFGKTNQNLYEQNEMNVPVPSPKNVSNT